MMATATVLHSRMRLLWERFEEALASSWRPRAGRTGMPPDPGWPPPS